MTEYTLRVDTMGGMRITSARILSPPNKTPINYTTHERYRVQNNQVGQMRSSIRSCQTSSLLVTLFATLLWTALQLRNQEGSAHLETQSIERVGAPLPRQGSPWHSVASIAAFEEEFYGPRHGNALITNETNRWVLGSSPNRWPAVPVITGDGFRALADFICEPESGCDNLDVAGWVMRHGLGRIPIVYVKIDIVDVFIEKVLEPWLRRLRLRFVLVTHNGDMPAPAAGHETLLDDPLLVAWFGQNPRIVHPKLVPIPIGFRNR